MKGADFDTDIPGYISKHYMGKSKRRPGKKKRAWGGILIMIKQEYAKHITISEEKTFLVWFILHPKLTGDKTIHMGFVYIAPEGSWHLDPDIDYMDEIEMAIARRSQSGEISIWGDFNARTGKLFDGIVHENPCPNIFDSHPIISDIGRENVDSVVTKRRRELAMLCKTTGLRIQNGRKGISEFTCYRYDGESVVDYLITTPSLENWMPQFQVLDLDVNSDHCGIQYTLNIIKHARATGKNMSSNTKQTSFKWESRKQPIDLQHLNDPFSRKLRQKFLTDIIADDVCVDNLVNNFNEPICYAASKTFKKHKLGQNGFPINVWFDNECKDAKSNLHKKGKSINGPAIREQYHQDKKLYKGLLQRKKRVHFAKIADELELIQDTDPKRYWEFWRSKKCRSQPTDYIDLNTFTDFYKKQNENIRSEGFDLAIMDSIKKCIHNVQGDTMLTNNEPLNDILNAPISHDEIIFALKKAKARKAPGIDGIPVELYKHGKDTIDYSLVALFNKVFENGIYPTIWCEGLINPIYKKTIQT